MVPPLRHTAVKAPIRSRIVKTGMDFFMPRHVIFATDARECPWRTAAPANTAKPASIGTTMETPLATLTKSAPTKNAKAAKTVKT